MKLKLLLCISFYFAACSFASAQLTWTSEISVANGGTYGNSWPRIVLANGNPVVMWGNSNSGELYVSAMNGGSFNTPVEMTLSGVSAFVQDWAGPDIASFGNDVFVTYSTSPVLDGTVYVRKSSDGGLTFGDTVRAETLVVPEFPRFPTITVKPDGNPLVMWMYHDSNGTNTKYQTVMSTDGGMTFQPEVETSSISPGGLVCDCCPAQIASNGSHVVGMYRNNDNNQRDIWLSSSSDGGLNFTQTIDCDNTDWNLAGCPSAGPDGIVDGDILTTVFMSGVVSPRRVYVTQVDLSSGTVLDNTNQFAVPVPSSASLNLPRIDGSGDTLGIVWEQNVTGDVEAVFTYSTGGTGAFNTVYDTLNTTISQIQTGPDIAYGNGTFHFVWRDLATGDVMYRSASFSTGVGLAENTALDISVYPNPARDVLYFKGLPPGSGQVNIYNVAGELVNSEPLSNARKGLQTSSLSDGVYILEVSSGNSQWKERIVITH